MEFKKIKREKFSNSGRTKTTKILLVGSGVWYEVSKIEEPANAKFKGGCSFDTELPITDSDKAFFLEEKMRNEKKESAKIEAEEIRIANEKAELESFLNKEFIDGIKYNSIYNKAVERLNKRYHHTHYEYLDIAFICLNVAGLIDLDWLNLEGYDEDDIEASLFPRPKDSFVVEKIRDRFGFEEDKIKSFYIISKETNKATYLIKCERSGVYNYRDINNWGKEIDYKNFKFEIHIL
jgi:hypothetical protein